LLWPIFSQTKVSTYSIMLPVLGHADR
jgi:hypothetical protein